MCETQAVRNESRMCETQDVRNRNESRMNIVRSLYHDPVQKAVSGDIYIPVQSARGEMLNDKITLLGL